MSEARRREVLTRRDALVQLLAEFGARPVGWDPGVMARRLDDGRLLNFDASEWEWLEPLLDELKWFRDAYGARERE